VKVVVRGGKGGAAEPGLTPIQVDFGGKEDLILPKAVVVVSMLRDSGNQPQDL